MIRGLLVAATAGVIVGPVNVPAAGAEPLECIAGRMNTVGSCYYSDCDEAFAANECDIPVGHPHYCSDRDSDGDGIACECP